MGRQLFSITIKGYKDGIEWLASMSDDREYSGCWQRSPVPLAKEEVENILKILTEKTKVLYTHDMDLEAYSNKWYEVYRDE